MEIGNMIHMGADLVSQILMIYSSSPMARRLCDQLETGDPFNVDVKLDMNSKNRNAEILSVYLKTKGLRIGFKRTPKKKINPITIDPLMFSDNKQLIDPLIIYRKDERFNLDAHIKHMLEIKKKKKINPIIIDPIEYFEDPNAEEYEKNHKFDD